MRFTLFSLLPTIFLIAICTVVSGHTHRSSLRPRGNKQSSQSTRADAHRMGYQTLPEPPVLQCAEDEGNKVCERGCHCNSTLHVSCPTARASDECANICFCVRDGVQHWHGKGTQEWLDEGWNQQTMTMSRAEFIIANPGAAVHRNGHAYTTWMQEREREYRKRPDI